MGTEKQENGHINSRWIKLDYEHDQELFGKDYSDIFSSSLVRHSRKSNQF